MLSVPTGNGIVITGWLRCQSCSLWCYLVGLWIRSSSSCLHQTHHSRIQDFPMWKINCSVRFLAARLRHQSTPPWGLMMWCGSVSSELSLNWSTSLNALEHFVLPTVLFPCNLFRYGYSTYAFQRRIFHIYWCLFLEMTIKFQLPLARANLDVLSQLRSTLSLAW